MRRSSDCLVRWGVKSQMGEYWRHVGRVGVSVGDVFAYYGSTVWEEGREASVPQWGEDRGTVCAEVKGEFAREKSGGVLGEARSLKVKPSQSVGESRLGSRKQSTESGNCTTPRYLALVPEKSAR